MIFYYRKYIDNAEERELKKETKEIKPSTERTENDQVIKTGTKEVNINILNTFD